MQLGFLLFKSGRTRRDFIQHNLGLFNFFVESLELVRVVLTRVMRRFEFNQTSGQISSLGFGCVKFSLQLGNHAFDFVDDRLCIASLLERFERHLTRAFVEFSSLFKLHLCHFNLFRHFGGIGNHWCLISNAHSTGTRLGTATTQRTAGLKQLTLNGNHSTALLAVSQARSLFEILSH